jgi:hypothetical protein
VLPEQGHRLGSQARSSARFRRHAADSSARVHHLGYITLQVGGGCTPAPVATANGAVLAARHAVVTVARRTSRRDAAPTMAKRGPDD